MPGSRDKNLRTGDIHESFGLFLLQGIALTAPIPRTEDVGADAFVTLIKARDSRRLMAEDSFLVQLKPSSVAVVEYKAGAPQDWLLHLEMPFFLGRVDVRSSRIDLYPAHRVFQLVHEPRYEVIALCLDKVNESNAEAGTRLAQVGPPALSWSVSDLLNDQFAKHAYEVLKPHVAIQQRNIRTRDFGYIEHLHWETGKPPQPPVDL